MYTFAIGSWLPVLLFGTPTKHSLLRSSASRMEDAFQPPCESSSSLILPTQCAKSEAFGLFVSPE